MGRALCPKPSVCVFIHHNFQCFLISLERDLLDLGSFETSPEAWFKMLLNNNRMIKTNLFYDVNTQYTGCGDRQDFWFFFKSNRDRARFPSFPCGTTH